MEQKRTYEELVELLQEGRIGHLQFVLEGGDADDYREWCRTHGTEECDESAEFYIEQTEAEMEDMQLLDDEDYGVWL